MASKTDLLKRERDDLRRLTDHWKLQHDEHKELNAKLAARVKELEKALARQCDNMAFIVNHVTMPEKWRDKWERELAEDRVALTANTERKA